MAVCNDLQQLNPQLAPFNHAAIYNPLDPVPDRRVTRQQTQQQGANQAVPVPRPPAGQPNQPLPAPAPLPQPQRAQNQRRGGAGCYRKQTVPLAEPAFTAPTNLALPPPVNQSILAPDLMKWLQQRTIHSLTPFT